MAARVSSWARPCALAGWLCAGAVLGAAAGCGPLFLSSLSCVSSDPLCAQDGASPLVAAAWEGHTEVLKLLIRAQADVNKAMNVSGRGWGVGEVGESEGERSVCMCRCMHAGGHGRVLACAYVHLHVLVDVWLCVCACVHMHVCVCMRVFVCVGVCVLFCFVLFCFGACVHACVGHSCEGDSQARYSRSRSCRAQKAAQPTNCKSPDVKDHW